MNFHSRDGGDALRRNAAVDEGVAATIHVEIIDDCRVIINFCHFRPRDSMSARMRIAKIPRRHKCEKVHTQSKIKISAYSRAVVKKSHAFPVNGARWQRRPAAIVV